MNARITYLPGPWLALVRHGHLVLLPGDTDPGHVENLWEALDGAPGVETLLSAVLAARGMALTGMDPFGIISLESDVHTILRGPLSLAAEGRELSTHVNGHGVTTWMERRIPRQESLGIALDDVLRKNDGGDPHWLPITEGIVPFGRLHVDLPEEAPEEIEPLSAPQAIVPPAGTPVDASVAGAGSGAAAASGTAAAADDDARSAEQKSVKQTECEPDSGANADMGSQPEPESESEPESEPELENEAEPDPEPKPAPSADAAPVDDAAPEAEAEAEADAEAEAEADAEADAEAPAEPEQPADDPEPDVEVPSADAERAADVPDDTDESSGGSTTWGPVSADDAEDGNTILSVSAIAAAENGPGTADEPASDDTIAGPHAGDDDLPDPEVLIDAVPWLAAARAQARAGESTGTGGTAGQQQPESTEDLDDLPTIASVPGTRAPAAHDAASTDEDPGLGDHDGHTVMRGDLPTQVMPVTPSGGGAANPSTGPQVLGRLCPTGHANPPTSSSCAQCGASLSEDPREVPRPALGRMVISDGETVDLDRPAVVGRQPSVSRSASGSMPRVVQVKSPSGDISRSHLEVQLEGWHVMLVDLKATNGTMLVRAGMPPRRLGQGEKLMLLDGDIADLGDGVSLRFEGLL